MGTEGRGDVDEGSGAASHRSSSPDRTTSGRSSALGRAIGRRPSSPNAADATGPSPPIHDRLHTLERFFENSSELLCVANFDGQLIEVSPSWTRVLGWSPQELVGRPYLDFVHPGDVEATLEAARGLLRGQPVEDFVNRYRHADGSYRWLSWRSIPEPAEQRMYAVVRDVTSERQNAVIGTELEHVTGVGTWTLDPSTQEVGWSPTTRQLHGLDATGSTGLDASGSTDPDASAPIDLDRALGYYPQPGRSLLESAVQRIVEGGEPFDLELPFEAPGRPRQWVRATGRAELRHGTTVRAYGTFQDITEQYLERESLRHFRDIVELSEEGIAELDGEMRVGFTNQRMAAMLGTTPEDLRGRVVWSMIHPDDVPTALGWLDDVHAGTTDVTRGVLRLQGPHGTTLSAQIAARVTRDDDAGIDAISLVVTDVSAREQRRAELDEAHAALEEAQRMARLGHWATDLTTGELTWSAVVYEIFGFDPATTVPSYDAFIDAVHPDDREAVLANDAAAVDGGAPAEITHRIVRPDGVVRIVREIAGVETDDDGVPVRRAGTVQDITELQRTEQALRDNEELLQRVLTATNDGWWDNDVTTGVAFHSDRWYEIHGYEPGELADHPELWRSLMHPDDLPRMDARFASVVEQQQCTFTLSGRIVHKHGHLVPVVVRGLIDYDAAGHPVRISGVTTDVTEIKKAESVKDEFISTVSHELRTPLTSIGGALDLLEAGVAGNVPPPIETLLDVARRNTSRLRLLIDDLLDMERLSTGRTRFRTTPQPLEPLLERALHDNATYATENDVCFELTERFDEAQVTVDADRLQQVLANYLSNAAKFAPTGSTVQIRMRASDGCVRTEVIDHGPGVPEELGDAVFDRFVQADASDHRSRGGTGLGLAISREIVERLGGQVGYDSEPGRTCFWFDLPTPT